MSWPVRSGKSGTIQKERYRQILQSHFLEDLIVAGLQEVAVEIDDGTQAGLALAGGKLHGVRFANASIKEPIREAVANLLQVVALAHGRGHDGDPRILLHLLIDRLA